MRARCGNGGIIAAMATALLGGVVAVPGTASAVPNLFDNFNNGVGGDIVWTPITGVNGTSTTPVGINNLMQTSSSKNFEGTGPGLNSALTPQSDPAAWNGYTDFGSTTGALSASVWIFEDRSYSLLDDPGNNQPVNGFIGVVGENGSNQPAFTDFYYLGVVGQGGSRTNYGTRNITQGFTTSAIPREAGWTKLQIDIDAVGPGAMARFYVDTPSLPMTLIDSTPRGSVPLRFVRLGTNDKSYENFWYDNVSVVPEPTSLAVLGGVGAIGLFGRRRRQV